MSKQGIVIQPGQGPVSSFTPGRAIILKLLSGATDASIMLFEETIPVGTKSTLHLHQDSDEVAYVLSGEVTFHIGDEVTTGGPGTCAFFPRNVAHAWKNTGSTTGKVLFMYTPAAAGRYIEATLERPQLSDAEKGKLLERYRWEVLGPNPL